MGEYQGRPHIVMAYVEGDMLSSVIAREDLILDRSLGIATRVCEALSSARAASVAHRDIKPDNIIIGHDGSEDSRLRSRQLRGVSKLTREASTVCDLPPLL